jgi:hypothetical protein
VYTGLERLALTDIEPRLWLPGSHVAVYGASFVDSALGTATLSLRGQVSGQAVSFTVALTYVDPRTLSFDVDPAVLGGASGTFDGDIMLAFDSLIDGRSHAAPTVHAQLGFAQMLSPRLDQMATEPRFVNDPVGVAGDGFLLGGGEGETRAVLDGCFQPDGQQGCTAISGVEIPAQPANPFDRTAIVFPYATSLSGIRPGSFHGQVKLRNVLSDGETAESATTPVSWTIGRPRIVGATPTGASLGQFLFVQGRGFVGGPPDEATLLKVSGTFTPEAGGGAPVQVQVSLVPEFQSGSVVRYVLDEQDALGHLVDLRQSAGHFSAMVTPNVRKGGDALDGDGAQIELDLLHVKQVVWVRFLDSYQSALRRFGLLAVDTQIRDRILGVAQRDYLGVNIEFRTDEPKDFALYSTVDIGGVDPTGQGQFGFDNTPGKDSGNLRLFDHLGGFNATTQSDGYPGYGGIFPEQFLGFSEHPHGVLQRPDHTPLFDHIFDPFRPDSGGGEASDADGQALLPPLADGSGCPARDRPSQLQCAVFVLGNLIGTTTSHETGHSLGLAYPNNDTPCGDMYHDCGDMPNRLMENGGSRPFPERAELVGQGPGVFCQEEFEYMATEILQGAANAPPNITRPSCY